MFHGTISDKRQILHTKMDYCLPYSRDLPRHGSRRQHWIAPHSYPASSFLSFPALSFQDYCHNSNMINRSRARYDPEIFSPVSPDRANRKGRKLVNDMEALRGSAQDRNSDRLQRQDPRPDRSQDLGPVRESSSRAQEQRHSAAQSGARVQSAREKVNQPSPPQTGESSKRRPRNLGSQHRRTVHFEAFDELVKQLRDMDLNIAQLQMLVDREAELWDLHADEVPRYLDALLSVIEAYGKSQPEQEPIDASMVASFDAIWEQLGPRQEEGAAMQDKLDPRKGSAYELGEGQPHHQQAGAVAGSSGTRLSDDKKRQMRERYELESAAWWEALPELAGSSLSTRAAAERQPAALPPSPARLSQRLAASDTAKEAMPAELAQGEKNKIEKVVASVPAEVIGPDSVVSHTTQASDRRKTSVTELRRKLARNISSMVKSLKANQRIHSSGKPDKSADSGLFSAASGVSGHQSKREGKRPQRKACPTQAASMPPLANGESASIKTVTNEQPQTGEELTDCFAQAELLRRAASTLRGYAVARSQHKDGHNLETLQKLRQVVESAAKILQDYESSLLTECVCCGDQKNTILAFSPHPPTYSCEHPIQTCKECMHRWLASELAGKGCKSLHCPECREELDYEDVRRGASEETKEKYDRQITLHALSEDPDFAWCLVSVTLTTGL